MSRPRPARRRPAFVAALALLLAGCRAQGDKPGFVVMPGMQSSVPYDAYDRNPVTHDGQTLLLPPEGTVPFAGGAFPYGPGPEEAERAGRELVNPFEATPAHLARGKQVFENVCSVCHGPGGQGDGPIIGRFPNPPSLTAPRAVGLPDGRVFHVITHGQGLMPSHAAQVLPVDRWRAVLYVRALQQASAAVTANGGGTHAASEPVPAAGGATAAAGDEASSVPTGRVPARGASPAGDGAAR